MESTRTHALAGALFCLWIAVSLGWFACFTALGAFAYYDTPPGETPVCVEWWDNATHLVCSHYE